MLVGPKKPSLMDMIRIGQKLNDMITKLIG
jgi:hypothetical protein